MDPVNERTAWRLSAGEEKRMELIAIAAVI
jgi:hypothetical protein